MDDTNPAYRMALASSVDCSLIGLMITSGGAMPENVAPGFLDMADGHFFRGIGKMMKKKNDF